MKPKKESPRMGVDILFKGKRKEGMDSVEGASIKEGADLTKPAPKTEESATDIVRKIKRDRGQT